MRLRRNSAYKSVSPSVKAMKTTEARATANGGVTVDFDANVENIREVSRDLEYNILQDASFVYVPSSYGEGKNFVQNPSIRNTVRFSQELENSTFWELSNVTVSTNTINAPDGTLTADKVQETAASGLHYVQSTLSQNVTKKIGDVTTYTVFLKSAERTNVSFHLNEAGAAFLYCNFNLATGAIGTSSGTTNNTIVYVGGGWWKCSVTRLTTFAGGTYYSAISTTGDEQISYTGTAGYGFYVGGFQVEQGSIATPYQRTTDGISDFTFTRATTSTVTNKQGIIEDSCYNLIKQSETFSDSSWTKSESTVTANAAIAPNGTQTAFKLVESVNSAGHYVAQINQFIGVVGATYTFSCYAKAAERTIVALYPFTNGSGGIRFDLSSGTVLNTDPSIVASSITSVGDGWYRCSASRVQVSATNISPYIYLQNPATNYTGNGTSGVYIWGAELVAGATPRPYLRTTNRLNVPKLDYSRSLSEPSLLIEPQRTNLITWSDEFSNAAWTKNNSTVTANSITPPNGTSTAYKVVPSTLNTDSHWLRQIYSTGGVFTFSIYAKNAGYNYVYITPTLGTLGGGLVDLTTGAVSNVDAGTSISAVNVGGGWWKISATRSVASGGNFAGVYVFNNSSLSPYAGDGTSGVYIWTSQVEAGSNATTYIPTTTATVTRNRESNEVDLFNNNMLNKDNFTLYVEGYLYDYTNTNATIMLGGQFGLAANSVGFFDGLRGIARDADNINQIVGTSLSSNSAFKVIIQRNGTSIKYFRNGVLLGSQTISVYDYRYLSVNDGQGSTFTIDKILLFNRTLSDAECINLTTP